MFISAIINIILIIAGLYKERERECVLCVSHLKVKNYGMPTKNYYFIKKSVRKILRVTKRFIKYSKNIETETTLLIHFCKNLEEMDPSYKYNQVLLNMYFRQLNLIEKNLEKMHEDLSYDFRREVDLLIK